MMKMIIKNIYMIKLKKEEQGKDLVKEIKSMSGVKNVNLFFDEEG